MSSQMTQDQWVKCVVEEVMKRLHQRLSERRVIVIGNSDIKSDVLHQTIRQLEGEGYICEYHRCEDLCLENLPMAFCEGLLVDDFSIGEAQQLVHLEINATRLKVVYEALRQGKPVYVVSDDFNLEKNSKLQTVVTPVLMTLEAMGVKIIGKKSSPKVMQEKVITAELMKQMDSQVLLVREDAVLTYGAKEYLKTHQIRIERK